MYFHNNKTINTISDSKRQQTTAVDYKRLINGFFLTNSVILRHQISKRWNTAFQQLWIKTEGKRKHLVCFRIAE